MTEETIFLAALDKQDPTERAAYLDSACAGNPALRQRVEQLLQSHDDPNFLGAPAFVPPVEGDSDATQDIHQRSASRTRPTNEELAFLGPPRKPGLLGSLNHYDILEIAGRGGMGIVFKARDTKLQRIVAIKVLPPPLAADGAARQRFVREAQAAAAVRDQHVVSIHAVEGEGAVPYLVMEFIDGVTLEAQIKVKGPIAVKEILRIGMQAAEGLAAAHRQGLIHRDVKPANILLENGVQRVKITDFGLARVGDNASLTQSGTIAGTPLYMSPEQASAAEVDHRTDLFSLGSVLYTMCTGNTAFRAPNTMAVLKRVCDDTPRPIRDLNHDIPDWLAAIVDKLLAKDPADRYQTAAEVAELLGDHLARLNYSGPVQVSRGAAPKGRNRLLIFGAAGTLLCVGLAALLAWYVATESPHPSNTGGEVVRADPTNKAKSDDGTHRDEKPGDRKPEPDEGKKIKPPPADPRILTVSQKLEDGGQYRTINAALEAAEPGKIIRVLDNAVYKEYLLIDRPAQHRGVILEAVGKATLRHRADGDHIFGVRIRGVPNFTLRGFRFESSAGSFSQVQITGTCPGAVLENLDMAADKLNACVEVWDMPLSGNDAPLVLQNCTLCGGAIGVLIAGVDLRNPKNVDRAVPSGHIAIRSNTMLGFEEGITMRGAIYRTHVTGNRIKDSKFAAIDLIDPLPGTTDVLIANNTLVHNHLALRLWDDSAKGKEFLKCKNMRFQNNTILDPRQHVDSGFVDHRRGNLNDVGPGDVPELLKSPQWRFSHNWRELVPPKPDRPNFSYWIPECPQDKLQVPIPAGSRKIGDPDFLRPPKDSPLAIAGVNDAALPVYVGAVPPEGVEPWDWEKTWKALAR